jgi:3-ketosteroid 9alpha-monooxygenase subunit B
VRELRAGQNDTSGGWGDSAANDRPHEGKLLDRLLAAGLDAPYSCREGRCSTCARWIGSGKVNRLGQRDPGHRRRDRAGMPVAPITDEVSISYE